MDYQTGQSVCPKCGNSEQVRTVRELFDMMSSAHDQAFQRLNQFRQPGQGPGGAGDDDDSDHYNVEGSDARRGWGAGGGFGGRRSGYNSPGDFGGDFGSDIAGAAIGGALGFAGRAIGKRLQRAFEEKVLPAMENRAAQSQQQWEQSKADQEAIAERYPELRGCMRDKVVFLDGGYRTVPISEIKMPVTLDQADALVARLR